MLLTIRGTHCKACKSLIEDICTDISGLRFCRVDFQTGATEIEHEENFDWQKFKTAVESLGGYKVEINQSTHKK
jgi:cation transport ATPase